MNIPFIFPVVIILAFVLASLISYFAFRKSQVAAIGFAVSCLLGTMFFAFGFLASFEGSGGHYTTAKIIYAVLFSAAAAGIISAIRRLINLARIASDQPSS